MPRLIVELETDLYRMLQEAARINQLSLQEECVASKGVGDAHATWRPCSPSCAPMTPSAGHSEAEPGQYLQAAITLVEGFDGNRTVAAVLAELITQLRALRQQAAITRIAADAGRQLAAHRIGVAAHLRGMRFAHAEMVN